MTDVVEAVVATPVEDVQAVEEPVPEPVAHTPEPVTVPAEPVPEPAAPVVKQKRKRTQKQIDALANARKAKANKRKKLSKPVKIERKRAVETSADTEGDFSWSKECLKASLLAGLGLASVFVQQKLAQKPPPLVEVQTPDVKNDTSAPPQRSKNESKDPFGAYRH
jgi:hypothetical protein